MFYKLCKFSIFLILCIFNSSTIQPSWRLITTHSIPKPFYIIDKMFMTQKHTMLWPTTTAFLPLFHYHSVERFGYTFQYLNLQLSHNKGQIHLKIVSPLKQSTCNLAYTLCESLLWDPFWFSLVRFIVKSFVTCNWLLFSRNWAICIKLL